MRDIFCLLQGQDEPTKAYYRSFEASISTSEIEKFIAKTHVELSNTYAEGGDYMAPRGLRKYASSFLKILNDTQGYGMN